MTEKQKQLWVQVCEDLLERASNDDIFLKSIFIGVEIWGYGYDVAITMKRRNHHNQDRVDCFL